MIACVQTSRFPQKKIGIFSEGGETSVHRLARDNTHITPQKYFLYQVELEFEVLVIKKRR